MARDLAARGVLVGELEQLSDLELLLASEIMLAEAMRLMHLSEHLLGLRQEAALSAVPRAEGVVVARPDMVVVGAELGTVVVSEGIMGCVAAESFDLVLGNVIPARALATASRAFATVVVAMGPASDVPICCTRIGTFSAGVVFIQVNT